MWPQGQGQDLLPVGRFEEACLEPRLDGRSAAHGVVVRQQTQAGPAETKARRCGRGGV